MGTAAAVLEFGELISLLPRLFFSLPPSFLFKAVLLFASTLRSLGKAAAQKTQEARDSTEEGEACARDKVCRPNWQHQSAYRDGRSQPFGAEGQGGRMPKVCVHPAGRPRAAGSGEAGFAAARPRPPRPGALPGTREGRRHEGRAGKATPGGAPARREEETQLSGASGKNPEVREGCGEGEAEAQVD